MLLGKKKLTDLEKAIQQYEDQLPIVQADGHAYDHLRAEIKRVCFITTKQTVKATTPSAPAKPKPDDSQLNRSNRHQMDSQGKRKTLSNESSILPAQSILSHIPETPAHYDQDLTIDAPNHFSHTVADKFIVSFEEDTKKLHLFYLNDSQGRIQTFTLNLDFRIPVNHR